MQWRKLGLLYVPDGGSAWAASHAAVPTPLRLSDDVVRLYVAHADRSTVSRLGYIDVALADPTRCLAVAAHPVLDVGERGAFDDNGVNGCCIVEEKGRLRLYYVGFQLQTDVPYTLLTGLATTHDPDGPFTRTSSAPILGRVEGEEYFRTAPCVMYDEGRWRMWYIGGNRWVHTGVKQIPNYRMRHTESLDGISWNGPSVECLAPNEPEEVGFGRPYVLRDRGVYRMWYSIRGIAGYRLGYATSPDGFAWTRRDGEVGIERSASGWDSEMICFAAILRHGSRWLMFYNGNGYGRTGVGVAVSDGD